jgi:thioredoxin-like negative regulator of GroEL
MTARRRLSLQVLVAAIGLVASGAGAAWAGEEDDLQREIDTQKTGVADLERLDDLKATTDEIALLRAWLDEAWSLRSKHEYDQVRQVLDRTLKQADLIRAKITLSKLQAQVQKREAALADLRAKIAKTKKTLADTTVKKKVLDGGSQ